MVSIQKLGNISHAIAIALKDDLNRVYKDHQITFEVNTEELELEESEYDDVREQYDASKILDRLMYLAKDNEVFRVLGVLDEDIYASDLNFVFGVAKVPKFRNIDKSLASLISVARLRESYYGKPKNEQLFRERILKEALHEIGHTFGLDHCDNLCVMKFSNSLPETDIKPAEYCNECNLELNSNL
mgnify:CR=1 FL=1